MSARMETEVSNWHENEIAVGLDAEQLEVLELENILRNIDRRNLVPPLQEAQSALSKADAGTRGSDPKRREALALQQRWTTWLARRELLRDEIKRGKDYLEQVRQELASTRARMEDWTLYERECGKNPLFQYAETLSMKERIEHFLPDWLKRREEQLNALTTEMEACARENGLEHLL